jgi:hypothetical protein
MQRNYQCFHVNLYIVYACKVHDKGPYAASNMLFPVPTIIL